MAKSQYPDEDLGRPIPYDPNFHGPDKNRSCTDVICLCLFIVFIGVWIGLGIYAIKLGNPNILLVPKDSQGSHCGLDLNVRDKPYLFFFDLTKCIGPQVPITGCPTPQVCVKECPSNTYYVQIETDADLKNHAVCMYDVNTATATAEEIRRYISEGRCASWYLPSVSVQKRCVPKPNALNNISNDILTGLNLNETALNSAINNIQLLAQLEEVGLNIVQDVSNSWYQILGGIGIAVLICIIYIAIMRWIAAIMVWLSIFGVIALLTFCVYATATKYANYVSSNDTVVDRYTNKTTWLILLIISSVILGITLLVLLFLRKRIVLAIALIKEGSKAVASVTSSLIFPVFPWILQVGVILYAIAVALYLSTIGQPLYQIRNMDSSTCVCTGDAAGYLNNTDCDPDIFQKNCFMTGTTSSCTTTTCHFVKVSNPPLANYLQAFNLFGFFWSTFFVSAMGQMILASIFATWYWAWNKSELPFFAVFSATGRTLRYHIGTLAFGSLIIAICRMIRVFLEYIDQQLKKYDNAFTKAIMCCLKCFFWCLEKFLKFINKNAYIMCAIHGKNFCASAKDAFSLLMRNIIRVFVLDKVTDFLFFLSKLLLTAGVGCIAYAIFVGRVVDVYTTELNYELVPVIIIIICTFFIATIFFSVYSMAVDTLFLCFLEDCERNDGSAEKPYFMSKQLMKILGKRNKMH